MNLYELSARFRELADLAFAEAENDEGRIPAEMEFLLDNLQASIDDKLAGCCAICRELDATEAAYRTEAAYHADKARKAEAHCERLKAYMKRQLEELGQTSRQVSAIFRVAIQKSPDRIEIIDFEGLPPEFFRVTKSAKLADIMDAVKRGQQVPGTAVVSSTHLRIR